MTGCRIIVSTVTLGATLLALGPAEGKGAGKSRTTRGPRDVWGHTYKRQTNLFRDRDGNGVLNLYQQRDRQPKVIRSKSRRPGKQRR
ncbi:hypothetical protein RW64_09335 [Geobacter sulfurreducens]|nr:hypothetical protein RW64_09335 [Geobacter sulfurreducens]